jgi:hypothetical protein
MTAHTQAGAFDPQQSRAQSAAPQLAPRPRRKATARGGFGDIPEASPGKPTDQLPGKPRDPGSCPVRPVGHRKGQFYFFDRAGEFIELSATAVGQAQSIIALFGRESGFEWLRNKFPNFDKDGNWTDGFNVRRANMWLVDQCNVAGLFDPNTLPMRDHGVWLANGTLAVHVGDRVLFIGDSGAIEERPAGFADRGALWPSNAAVPPPVPACAAEVAQQVERLFGNWHWWNIGEERVFTGLWAAGLLGAAIRWRPHGLLVGPPGSGKSTLFEIYCALSPLAVYVNDYTAAGIRQMLTGRAAPLVLDEADEDPETMGRLQALLTLLRKASGGDGARVVRGSGDGVATSYTFMSPALLGSVLPPPLMPQDVTRISKMELVRIPQGASVLDRDATIAWARRNAPALWGRALAGLPRFRRNLAELRQAMAARGAPPRLCDQLGTILAARAMMLEDEPLDAAGARQDIEAVPWLMQTGADAVADSGPMRCLQHLLNSTADVLEGGQRPTFERLIDRAQRSPNDDDARRKLIDHGLKLTRFPAKAENVPESLLVSRSHPALSKVFAGTQWAGNRWGDDLKHLPGASVPEHPVKLRSGVKPRVVVVPLEHIVDADSDLPAAPCPADFAEAVPF